MSTDLPPCWSTLVAARVVPTELAALVEHYVREHIPAFPLDQARVLVDSLSTPGWMGQGGAEASIILWYGADSLRVPIDPRWLPYLTAVE